MTVNIEFVDGRVSVTTLQGTHIGFRMCDLEYDDRIAFMRAAASIAQYFDDRGVGFLKTQPVEERQRALEEALGVSFPFDVCVSEVGL